MLHQIKSYLRFLRRSTNTHGIHSPFVFSLVTKCFYDKREHGEYKVLDEFRYMLLANNSMINVTDFGAGSKIFGSNRRKISHIARTAGISRSRAKLLFRIGRYFEPHHILEIGTSIGLSTSALSLAMPDSHITTIEGCPQTAEVAASQFKTFAFENIVQKIGIFDTALSNVKQSPFDLIYFDGNHTKEATITYFETLLPSASADSVWIFDDIHWSAGMESAWKYITNHPKVTVAIDTFQWGFVFFRTGQEKENFVVRI